MSKNKKILELIKSKKECPVIVYGKIYRCIIDSFSKQKDIVIIKYDFTNTGKNYYFTSVPINNLII